jgi:putative hydrolase of the HAD superfamily
MTKAIIFDLWGTLVETGTWSPVKQVRNILNIRLPFSEYIVRMERSLMTSKFNSLQEAFENVCQEFSITATPEIMEELIGVWNKSWMLAKPYSDLTTLASLKENYQLVLISNTDPIAVPRVLEKFNLSPHFDRIFLSYELGLLKTDAAFLPKILDKLGLHAADCLMVGDSLQSDIAAANKAGIKSVLIDRRNKMQHNPKINNLQELIQHL